jgi:hypothetical protein
LVADPFSFAKAGNEPLRISRKAAGMKKIKPINEFFCVLNMILLLSVPFA